MSEHTPMDALDQRLAAYLQGRAEMAAAVGPGPDRIVASLAAGGGRVAFEGGRGGARLGGVPTLAGALLVMGLLVAMALALAAGSDRDDDLVVLPPTSLAPSTPTPSQAAVASPLRGSWLLDAPGSGIDATYGGPANSEPGFPDTFGSMVWFGPDGAMRVWAGVVGGCVTDGTWQAAGEQVSMALPTSQSGCELVGPGPEARVVRERLAAASTFELDGTTLTLHGEEGRPTLVYRAHAALFGDPPRELWELGELDLDLAASGIDPTISSGGVASAVTASIVFDDVDGIRATTAAGGEPCDDVAGTYVIFASLTVEIPAETGNCGDGPAYPDLEVRRKLTLVSQGELLDDGALRLMDVESRVLLVYRPRPAAAVDPAPFEGAWQLDFEASGIEGSYMLRPALKRSTIGVASSIDFADGVVSGGTGAGGGCDAFEGTYSDADGRFTIDLPDAAGNCGSGPVYPDLEVRQHLERTASWRVEDDELRLLDGDGALLLLYRRFATETP
jgi:hypothetical protein